MTDTPPRKPRGFACIPPERQREIARMGGLAVRPEDRSFSRDRDLARTAGREGGSRPKPRRPRDRE